MAKGIFLSILRGAENASKQALRNARYLSEDAKSASESIFSHLNSSQSGVKITAKNLLEGTETNITKGLKRLSPIEQKTETAFAVKGKQVRNSNEVKSSLRKSKHKNNVDNDIKLQKNSNPVETERPLKPNNTEMKGGKNREINYTEPKNDVPTSERFYRETTLTKGREPHKNTGLKAEKGELQVQNKPKSQPSAQHRAETHSTSAIQKPKKPNNLKITQNRKNPIIPKTADNTARGMQSLRTTLTQRAETSGIKILGGAAGKTPIIRVRGYKKVPLSERTIKLSRIHKKGTQGAKPVSRYVIIPEKRHSVIQGQLPEFLQEADIQPVIKTNSAKSVLTSTPFGKLTVNQGVCTAEELKNLKREVSPLKIMTTLNSGEITLEQTLKIIGEQNAFSLIFSNTSLLAKYEREAAVYISTKKKVNDLVGLANSDRAIRLILEHNRVENKRELYECLEKRASSIQKYLFKNKSAQAA